MIARYSASLNGRTSRKCAQEIAEAFRGLPFLSAYPSGNGIARQRDSLNLGQQEYARFTNSDSTCDVEVYFSDQAGVPFVEMAGRKEAVLRTESQLVEALGNTIGLTLS